MSFHFPLAGEVYSLGSALVWSFALILYRRSGALASPVALTLFKNLFALVLLVATLLVAGQPLLPPERTAREYLTLLASGFLGLGVADVLFLGALNRLGAGRTAIIECAYSPSVIVAAHLMLGEPVGTRLGIAAVLVGAAVVVGTWEPTIEGEGEGEGEGDAASAPRASGSIVAGAALGALSMITMAVAIVMAKPVLHAVDPGWAVAVRLVGGLVLPVGLALGRERAETLACLRPGPHWRVLAPAAFVGTYLSMTLWVLGFKYTQATIASVLNQTSTLFTLALAALLLKERLTARKLAAIALGSAGALAVIL